MKIRNSAKKEFNTSKVVKEELDKIGVPGSLRTGNGRTRYD